MLNLNRPSLSTEFGAASIWRGNRSTIFRSLLPAWGTQDWYLAAQTFLPVKKSVPEQHMFRPQSWFFSDYRPVNGVMLPHNVEIEEGLFTQVHIFDKIEANVKVDESVFSMPES